MPLVKLNHYTIYITISGAFRNPESGKARPKGVGDIGKRRKESLVQNIGYDYGNREDVSIIKNTLFPGIETGVNWGHGYLQAFT